MIVCVLLLLGSSIATAADDEKPSPVVSGAPGKGLSVQSADGRFLLNLRGRFQLRESFAASAPDDAGNRDVTFGTSVYTTRIWLQGHTLSKDIKYLLQLAVAPRDYRDGSISPIYDAYLDLTHSPDASVRIGQAFVPFDRLRTIREFALQLPDRPKAIGEFSLDRDIGAYVYSDHVGSEEGVFAYRLGVFGGGGPNVTTMKEPGGLGVVRLELNPFGPFDADSEGDLERREEPGLSIGAGFAYNANTPRARSTTSTTFSNGGTADYLHAAGDVVFKLRGFAIEGEVILRDAANDTIVTTDDAGAEVVEYTRSGWGAVVQPSIMLGKEIEVAARYSHSVAFDGTDPALISDVAIRGEEIGAGVSWYLNGHRFKVQGGWTLLFGSERSAGDGEHAASVLVDAMF